MEGTPKGNRLHIAIVGRMNVGKSSFLNMISGQESAIASPVAGTTTDVVEKAMELLPLGPVLFLDTAGVDDKSELFAGRMRKTTQALTRADVVILVTEPNVWTPYEDEIIARAAQEKLPVIVVINKTDVRRPSADFLSCIVSKNSHVVEVSCVENANRDRYLNTIKHHLIETAPDDFLKAASLIGDLLPSGGLLALVVPIDLQAPKGRLILPQVQTIRDALDNDSGILVVKERELAAALANLKTFPHLVVCDSQAILKVVADVPSHVLLTTFSILFARQKGDINAAAQGAAHIAAIKPGDKVLIAEACTHHALEDDIGRVKIPRWLRQYVGGEVIVDVCAGIDYPDKFEEYKLIIHCGGCMLNRRAMLKRIQRAREANVPITNYGIAICFLQGVAKRALSPFPMARLMMEQACEKIKQKEKEEHA